ncbi:MAG: hypothetical protein M0R40_00650 [Firmicutes bacterium]|nr:hypothetical protein [Bacillota bacterium]
MFDSGIAASAFVSGLKNEIDIALPISNKTYIEWLNALEQLLYTEFIREQCKIILANETEIDIESVTVPAEENNIRFEDIYTVFVDDVQLMKSTIVNPDIFVGIYYKQGKKLCVKTETVPEEIIIYYFVKPALKTVNASDVIQTGNVMLPYEFIDIVGAKLRGEAYKLANEDANAAKWLNDYNALLESFKAWALSRQSKFGM